MYKTNGEFSKINADAVLNGSIKTKSDIRIDGKLKGNLETQGRVIIGKKGSVNGKIICVNADIEGRFKGNLTALESLSLESESIVEGEVSVQKLIVCVGAIFNAKCSMHSKEDGIIKLLNNSEIRSKKEKKKNKKKFKIRSV